MSPSIETLYTHLTALRDAEDVYDLRHRASWAALDAWLRATHPSTRAAEADRRQETLISVVRSVHGMQAASPRQAAKWVDTIYRHKRIDALRRQQRDPVTRALERAPRDPDAPSLIENLAAEPAAEAPVEAVERVLTLVLEQVGAALEESVSNAGKRALRRTQAEAALLRLVRGWDAEAIIEALDYGEPVGKGQLYKWVERGRDGVRLGLDRWERVLEDAPGERETLAPVIAALREILDGRRADAGKPRPERRREARAARPSFGAEPRGPPRPREPGLELRAGGAAGELPDPPEKPPG